MTMSSAPHTYGAACRLAPVSELSPPAGLEGIPPIRPQFFYASPIPIDDPLSTTTIAGSVDSKSSKQQLRPFSTGDNNALEKAWLSLASDDDRLNHDHARRDRSPSPSLAKRNAERLNAIIQDLAAKHLEKHAHETDYQGAPELLPPTQSSTDIQMCCPELAMDAANELRESFCAVTRKRQQGLDQDRIIRAVMTVIKEAQSDLEPIASTSINETSQGRQISSSLFSANPTASSPFVLTSLSTSSRARSSSLSNKDDRSQLGQTRDRSITNASTSPSDFPPVLGEAGATLSTTTAPIPIRPPVVDDGISGKPFIRVEGSGGNQAAAASPLKSDAKSQRKVLDGQIALTSRDEQSHNVNVLREQKRVDRRQRESIVDTPVGVSRLHLVSLPVLQMKPIYWSPVNDVAIVLRATWFYRDNMLPVEPAVANQLEIGYRELRPYSETWRDEVRCAIEIGPLGEEKVSHPLWPKPMRLSKTKDEDIAEPPISSDPFCAARCFRGEASAEGTLEPVHPIQDPANPPVPTKMYASYHVIYKDAGVAFLLKPSLKPSAYYGRRPVAKISRGLTVGIPVIRGFDQQAWEAIHEKRSTMPKKEPKIVSEQTQPQIEGHGTCAGCKTELDQSQVTDLVLIAHGIGQKFAERVESFHFTHAVTAFRRAVNLELRSEAVKSILRPNHNGIMVLPVNWRHSLSFEDGGPVKEEDETAYTADGFTLKDIEPSTIPAVRSMISDVMFDIPFYMSHHKPKMIEALVGEANRVYRLWCSNNPGFAKNGRVHLIGHSLGSAMAIEVLSKQPTQVPRLDLSRPQPETTFFEFDTTNLFLLGSPAGFFLLLERGNLIPRKGRQKPGADPADTVGEGVVSEAGIFGCIAVDNIYNILAKEDPIAYLLNGTIDPVYASSLEVAHVPSATTSWYKSVGDAIRTIVPGVAAPTDVPVPGVVKPPTVRFPSQLELEIHDFTREEIAERKAFLLNDNGQIDFYLRSGNGPLEIQYLNMLSAHTSYWTNRDLVRLLCIEIGRRPGKAHTLPVMRAVKASRRLLPLRR